MKKFAFSFLCFLLSASVASACPTVGKLADFNCDGQARVVVVGDSLGFGFGDTKNGNRGGYVLRATRKLPGILITNLSVAGLRTRELLRNLDATFRQPDGSEEKEALREADVVVLDVGRNDRWLFGTPLAAYRNLKKAAALIRRKTARDGGSALVVQSVLMLPNRGAQGPWVKELNALILKGNTLASPADLRFDLVSKRLLSSDQIHPTSKGYDALSKVFVTYLTKSILAKVKRLRPDGDKDGVFDLFEPNRFGTDPNVNDSDGDGFSDGDELFILNSNPLGI